MTLTEIRMVLAARGLSPLKQLGQNFLHDENLLRWMADAFTKDVSSGGLMLEIGPGLGALTKVLLEKDLRLIVLEKDRGLSLFLRELFLAEIKSEKLILREGDALQLLPQVTENPEVICGNLPYYISTPLLMECLRFPGAPKPLVFLLQNEVGLRLASKPRSKVYGSLSAIVQVTHQVEIIKKIPGSVFYPTTEVGSVVVRLSPLTNPLVATEDRESFVSVVRKGFSQRRKKLSNLLPVQDSRRAEELSPLDWVALWKELRFKSVLQK